MELVGCPHKLKEFHKCYPGQPGPPKYLNEWLECWYDEDDKQPVEHRDKEHPSYIELSHTNPPTTEYSAYFLFATIEITLIGDARTAFARLSTCSFPAQANLWPRLT